MNFGSRASATRALRLIVRAHAGRKLFSGPSTDFLADTFDGNAFVSIKFGGGLIERCEQSCLFRNIRNIGLNLLAKPNQFADLANLFFEWQLREFPAHLGFHRATARVCFAARFPFGQITAGNRSLLFSARSLRATRWKARSARATNLDDFFERPVVPFFLISRSCLGPNLHHRSRKSPAVLLEDRGYPRSPNASREANSRRSGERGCV